MSLRSEIRGHRLFQKDLTNMRMKTKRKERVSTLKINLRDHYFSLTLIWEMIRSRELLFMRETLLPNWLMNSP